MANLWKFNLKRYCLHFYQNLVLKYLKKNQGASTNQSTTFVNPAFP